MAEFCLDCFNKKLYNKGKVTDNDVIMQWDFCENCGKNAPCVIYVKTEEQKRLERERELDG